MPLPFLTCPGAKKRAAWYLSAIVLGAAEARWGAGSLPFDRYFEPGCYTGAIGLAVMGRMGRADEVAWRFSDPAPGVSRVWNRVMEQPEEVAAYTEEAYRSFDVLWRGERGFEPETAVKVEKVAKNEKHREWDLSFTERQRSAFEELRSELNTKLFDEDPRNPFSVEDAASFLLYNHRCMNGVMRCGSGGAPTGEALRTGRKGARCFTVGPGSYPQPPVGCEEAEALRSWKTRPRDMLVTAERYETMFKSAVTAARTGERVVVVVDPVYFRWAKPKPVEESPRDKRRREEAAARRAVREAAGERLVGAKPGRRPSRIDTSKETWIPSFCAYTPEGFPLTVRDELRELVKEAIKECVLVVVMDHGSAGWWWEETGCFTALPGTEDTEPEMLGRKGQGGYAAVDSTSHFDSYQQVGSEAGRRAIRRDWLGVAGLRKGFHIPASEWVFRADQDPWLARRD